MYKFYAKILNLHLILYEDSAYLRNINKKGGDPISLCYFLPAFDVYFRPQRGLTMFLDEPSEQSSSEPHVEDLRIQKLSSYSVPKGVAQHPHVSDRRCAPPLGTTCIYLYSIRRSTCGYP